MTRRAWDPEGGWDSLAPDPSNVGRTLRRQGDGDWPAEERKGSAALRPGFAPAGFRAVVDRNPALAPGLPPLERTRRAAYYPAVRLALRAAGGAVVIAAGVAIAFASGATAAGAPITGQVAYDLGNRLLILDLDGTNKLLIPTPKQKETPGPPVWSRDGSAIAFVRNTKRGSDVYVAGVADRTLTRVARLSGYGGDLHWSPDGRQIALGWQSGRACDRGTAGTTSIYVVDARGGGARRLASVEPNPPSTKRTPFFNVLDWSPDGARLLYGIDVWRTGGDCGRYGSGDDLSSSLLHIGVAGGRPTVIPPGGPGQGEWSPNGQRIAFCGDGVIVARRDGRLVRRWPKDFSQSIGCIPGYGRWLTWSQSGEEVYATTDDRVVALRIGDGHRRTLFKFVPPGRCDGNWGCSMSIHARSPDGRFLLVEAEGGKFETRAMFLLATDGTQRYRLPNPYLNATAPIAYPAAFRLS